MSRAELGERLDALCADGRLGSTEVKGWEPNWSDPEGPRATSSGRRPRRCGGRTTTCCWQTSSTAPVGQGEGRAVPDARDRQRAEAHLAGWRVDERVPAPDEVRARGMTVLHEQPAVTEAA